MSRADLLIEIGTEEMPPGLLPRLAEDLGAELRRLLEQADLDPGPVTPFAAPRRLAVRIEALRSRQPDREQVRQGPPLASALDANGLPTPAGLGFARSCGVEFGALEQVETGRGPRLSHTRMQEGENASALIPGFLERAATSLVMPRRMRWGAGDDEFVRPVHWLVMLLGDAVIDATLWGVPAGRATRGHRFHAPGALEISSASDYERVLEDTGYVIPGFAPRRMKIRSQVEALAAELGGRVPDDPALLDEVTALVEWPVALHGTFEERFLEVPQEALISTMCANQKYFPVLDRTGQLLPQFVLVSNLESTQPEEVRRGNERVIRPRFADAEFFFREDRKRTLAEYASDLGAVAFEASLGSVAQRVERLTAIALRLAPVVGADPETVGAAASLSKADLLTLMVQEFPKLQGTMGRHYARLEGLGAELASAIEEHYLPRHAEDGLPGTATGRALALAERIELLAGFFAIGRQPTGDKDPYGLRRAALGLIRILAGSQLQLDLRAELGFAATTLPAEAGGQDAVNEAVRFVMLRLEAWLLAQGTPADVLQAVSAREVCDIVDFIARSRAVAEFRDHAAAADLAEANKRVANILAKSDTDDTLESPPDPALLEPGAETALHDAIASLQQDISALAADSRYREALEKMATLREVVGDYFDQVMVNCEDPALRLNRHRLLHQLRGLFLRVADVSCLQPRAGA